MSLRKSTRLSPHRTTVPLQAEKTKNSKTPTELVQPEPNDYAPTLFGKIPIYHFDELPEQLQDNECIRIG